jgi:hypothetical protein
MAMRQCIEDQRCLRKIKSDPDAIFMDSEDDGFIRTGTSIITVRARMACKALNMRLKLERSLLVIKANASKQKTHATVGIGRYLTQKNASPQTFEKLMSQEKHGVTFAILKNNIVSNKMLTDAKTIRSDAFFRLTGAARADFLPAPANIEQYQRLRTMCERCDKHKGPILAHSRNGCQANYTEITRRHNKVFDMMRRPIEEHVVNTLHSGIRENTMMERESPREGTRRVRSDLHFVASTFATRFTIMIDISCPYRRISHGKNAPQKVCVDRLKKSAMLAR